MAPDYFVDLDITLSKNITFHEHVNKTLAECYRKLFIIKKYFLFINETILLKLYVSYLRSCLKYGSVIWAPHNNFNIKLLDAFQHRILTYIDMIGPIVFEFLEKRMRINLAL